MIYLVSVFFLAQIHLFFKGDVHWYIFAQEHHLIELLLAIFIYKKLSFEEIELKLVSLALSIYLFIVLMRSFFYYSDIYNIYIFWTFTLLNIILFGYSIIKNTKIDYKQSKSLDYEYVYLLYRKPFNLLTLTNALIFDPYGSVAIYCDGKVYGFSKGYNFKLLPIEKSKKYLGEYMYIKTSVQKQEGKKILKGLYDSKWKINNNCFHIAKKFKN